jgi:thiol-disulfide isomerase/thioredoxin
VALAGCASETKPVAGEANKFRPADDAGSSASPAAVNDASPLEQTGLASAGGGLTAANAPASESGTARSGTGRDAGATSQAAKTRADTASSTADTKAPSGDIQQLAVLVDNLGRQQPKGTTQQEMVEDFVRIQNQRLAASRKILTLNPEPGMKRRIVQAMLQVFQQFEQLGIPGARAQLVELAKSLASDSDAELSRLGRSVVFDNKVSQLANQPLANGEAVLAEIKSFLAGEKGSPDPQVLELASAAASLLSQNGLKDDAAAAYELLAAAAANDPNLARQAASYKVRARLVKADLSTLLKDVIIDQPQAETRLLDTVKGLFTDAEPSIDLLVNIRDMASTLESTGHLQAAQACLDQLAALFKNAKEPELTEQVDRWAENLRKRAAIVGQPFVVEGVTLDGKPFDWSAYKGKVVLIDFWATWCIPCIEEISNIKANFDQFHTKGFDVVGVNVNTDLRDVREFFTYQDIPWTTVTSQNVIDGKVGEDPNAFSQLPMPTKYGVDAIPFVVLVGKDGKVDSVHVRGPKLKARLTQLLGEPATTDIPADPTSPAAPAAAKPKTENPKTGAVIPRGALSPVALAVAQLIFAADPAAPQVAETEAPISAYQAKAGLSTTELIQYIQKMLDKPMTIQLRPGFADAIVEACDRVLSADPPAKEADYLVAAESKLALLHRQAANGDKSADERLMVFVEKVKDDERPKIAHDVAFFRLEHKILIAAAGPIDEVPALLTQVADYFAKEKPVGRHLRLASATVALINRVEDGDQREKYFAQFGSLFSASGDKEMARYGKKLAKKPAPTELIGERADPSE